MSKIKGAVTLLLPEHLEEAKLQYVKVVINYLLRRNVVVRINANLNTLRLSTMLNSSNLIVYTNDLLIQNNVPTHDREIVLLKGVNKTTPSLCAIVLNRSRYKHLINHTDIPFLELMDIRPNYLLRYIA